MEGWVKLHRKFVSWEWFTDFKTSHLFLYLLLSANHEDKNWRGQNIKRGQLITGRKSLSEKTGLSEQTIRTSLDKLKFTNEVTIKTTNKNSVITILNYDLYQNKETSNQQTTSKTTNKQPTTNQQLTTNKNVNNIKNDKKDNIHPLELVIKDSNDERFLKFCDWIKSNEDLEYLKNLPKQINEKSFYKLLEKYDTELIIVMMEKIDAWLGDPANKSKAKKKVCVSSMVRAWILSDQKIK